MALPPSTENPIKRPVARYTSEQVLTARYAKALGHPVRVAILERLETEACCYHGDLADELPVAKSTLSQHLQALREAGLIQGTFTPPSVRYCINRENWEEAKNLLCRLMNRDYVPLEQKPRASSCDAGAQNTTDSSIKSPAG